MGDAPDGASPFARQSAPTDLANEGGRRRRSCGRDGSSQESALRFPGLASTGPISLNSFRSGRQGASHGVGGRTARGEYQLGFVRQGRGTQEAHLVHARRADRLPARHLHSPARHRPRRVRGVLHRPSAGRARHVQHVLGRRGAAHGGVRAQHHALHLGLDHHPASQLGDPLAGGDQERGRGGAQDAQPIYALPHRGAGDLPGLRHLHRA